MKIRDNKGSITIFVLVGLLFMSAFLLISYGYNVNKSKVAKEQFEIISKIYSPNKSEEESYTDAYTDLRKKNKKTLKSSSENNNVLELTKTFEENISDYKIYGNSVQNGTPSATNPVEIQSVGEMANLFDINSGFATNTSAYQTRIEENNIIIPSTSSGNAMSAEFNQYIPIIENEEYTYKIDLVQGSSRILFRLYDGSKSIIDDSSITITGFYYNGGYKGYYSDNTTSPVSFPNTVKYIRICTISMTRTDGLDNIYSNFQFTKGSMVSEYQPYGKYKIPVKVNGKNLFNIDDNFADVKSYYSGNGYYGHKYQLEPNTNYTISLSKNNRTEYVTLTVNNYHSQTDATTYWISHKTNDAITLMPNSKITFKTGNTGEIWINTTNGGGAEHFRARMLECFENLQIEKGTEATEYEEYKGKIVNIYLNEPLRKVGNYADYIDFKTQKVVRYVKQVIYDGTEDWNSLSWSGSGTNGYYYITIGNYGSILTSIGFNTHFERKDLTTEIAGVIGFNPINSNAFNEARIIIRPDMEIYTDVELWKTYLAELYRKGTPVKVYYVLATEDDNEKVSVPELKTYEDYTKIEVLTDLAPSKIEATYEGYTLE